MKHIFLLFLFLATLTLGLHAQCTTSAGNPVPVDYHLCDGGNFSVTAPPDVVFDANDVGMFIINHQPISTQDTGVVAVSTNGFFPFPSGYPDGATYNIYLYVGNPNNGGLWVVDLDDPCCPIP